MPDMTERELCDTFAANVRHRREELGISQRELADAAGVPQPVISRIERGDICISFAKLAPLATALKTTPAALQTQNVFATA
jgi:predicted transcriptional regulator